MAELIINPQEESKKREAELKKWIIIWAAASIGSIIGFALFMFLTQEKAPAPNLPWWVHIPAIICLLLAIPLLIKAWRADKLKAQLKQTKKGGK